MVDVNTDLVAPDEAGSEAVAVQGAIPVGQVTGEISERDLQYPSLNIVSKMGTLPEKFKVGDLVLNREYFLASQGGEPLKLVIMSCIKTYQDRTPFNPTGPRPTTYRSLREVADAGKYIDWRDDQPPTAEEVATAYLLIRKPADLMCMSFNNSLDGHDYAVARWTMTSTAYTHAARIIFTKSQIELRDGLDQGVWELSTTQRNIKGYSVAVPVLRLTAERTSEEFRKAARAVFQPQ